MRFAYFRFLCLLSVMLASAWIYVPRSIAQETGGAQQLERVEVEAPERRAASGSATSELGFGYEQSIPSGEPLSDFPLTPSQVISPTGRAANLATVPSAISVVEKEGITGQGESGIGDMVRGQPGTWASGYTGNFLNSQISIRGFSQTPAVANRVALLVNGRNFSCWASVTNAKRISASRAMAPSWSLRSRRIFT